MPEVRDLRSGVPALSGIAGSKVSINNTPATIIGVLQPAPFFPSRWTH